MEALRKSLKSHGALAKQQPEHLEEEKRPLLHHDSDCLMAQSSGSLDQYEEVIVNIDNADVSDKEPTLGSKSCTESQSSKVRGSSKKFKVSFEDVINETVRQRSKEFTHQPSFSAFEQNPWRSVVNKAKSRLVDLPEEHYRRTERTVRSDGAFGEDGGHKEDDNEDVPEEYRIIKHNTLIMLQWVSLVLITAALVCSLSIPAIKRQTLWDLPLWKWEIMVLVLICGRLASGWGIKVAVIFIEHNFLLRKRVLYFVYGLRRAVQNFLWLGLALLIWHLIFGDKAEKSKSRILLYGTKILVCFFIGTLIWLLKTLLVKVLASSFHVNAFFERIREALFNQYVIETLSGPPLFERRSTKEEEGTVPEIQQVRNFGSANPSPGDLKETLLAREGSEKLRRCTTVGKNSRISRTMPHKKEEEISIDNPEKLNRKNISAWNMRRMINTIRHGSLSTLDEQILDSDITDDSSLHIRTECQAKEAAKKIFQKVAKTGSHEFYLDDLMRFMDKEEALEAMHLIGTSCENEGISKSSLNHWLVNAFRERKALAFSLNDTKTAVDELHNMLNILVSLRVEEMNILTTVFLRSDNQKIKYPNSVLANKPIGNFYRSPDMAETIDFCVHISTPMEKIGRMKEKIKGYVKGNSNHWHPSSMVVVKDIEDMNKMKMSLWVTHRMNHQEMGERWARRTLLLEEMIKVFKELDMEYRLLPSDVNVRNMPPLVSTRLPSNWTTCAN
ncbi:unnamed protein product [Dovyalis caffra]|uniref:Mechanosensitive ion channel protein n=1 Tax=Dovyalis caffra TaxID=77055 RepID=A0AAV1S6X3_9ROSI|nr:unnamed protein product [Dovyalis caffra]